ncbi:MAG: hypothetical protein IJW05_04070 [Lentisphaeria bacterium]|nr:hypothetical protein [Lentisphaeria bacterium]
MAFFVLLSFTGKESKMKNLISVAQYPKSEIPERYIRIRDLKKACIICQHWTSRRDLRKVHTRYYQLPNEELSKVINDYLKKSVNLWSFSFIM